jgi:SAM-dependent methyltransferase
VDDLYEGQKRYYHLRAGEYDATSWEVAAEREPAELAALIGVLGSLPAARTLDVACGTGFLTQYLPGAVTLLDASEDMLALAAKRVPGAELVRADALPLPFPDGSFERVFASAFCGHLLPSERQLFLMEARRLAPELVLVEQTRGETHWEGVAGASAPGREHAHGLHDVLQRGLASRRARRRRSLVYGGSFEPLWRCPGSRRLSHRVGGA